MKLLKKIGILVLSIILISQFLSTEKKNKLTTLINDYAAIFNIGDFQVSIIHKKNVFPLQANKLPSFELGEAIMLLLPPDNSKVIDWSYLSNSTAIFWLDETAAGSNDNNERNGLMRVNVEGVKSTILKRTNFELAWEIQLISVGNPKYGPSSLKIGPGGSHEHIEEYLCFGTFAENCEFDPINSLKSSSIKIEKLCEHDGATTIKAFYLSAKNKRKTLARVFTNRGSGGADTTMELFFKKPNENPCDVNSL